MEDVVEHIKAVKKIVVGGKISHACVGSPGVKNGREGSKNFDAIQ